MSREIEFRVWNIDLQRYFIIGGDFTLMLADTGNLVQMWCSDGVCDEFPADVIEQFTGLLDSNGKKIFEGDVLMSKCGEKAFVYFFDGSFMVRIGKYYPVKTHQAYMKDNQFKVISNVHEEKL